jgi:hypothetical protein
MGVCVNWKKLGKIFDPTSSVRSSQGVLFY